MTDFTTRSGIFRRQRPYYPKTKSGNQFDAEIHRNNGFNTINRIVGAFVWTHALVISPPRNQGDFLSFFRQLFYLFYMPRLMAADQGQPFSS